MGNCGRGFCSRWLQRTRGWTPLVDQPSARRRSLVRLVAAAFATLFPPEYSPTRDEASSFHLMGGPAIPAKFYKIGNAAKPRSYSLALSPSRLNGLPRAVRQPRDPFYRPRLYDPHLGRVKAPCESIGCAPLSRCALSNLGSDAVGSPSGPGSIFLGCRSSRALF